MFCKNCGKEIDNNAAVCIHCGVATAEKTNGINYQVINPSIKKCPNCGYEGKMKPGPLLRPIDWIITIATFIIGFGLIYLIVILILRYDEQKREQFCPNCGVKQEKLC